MSEKKISEENLKKYISSLKSQLSFYRERCLELQQREWTEQELQEELKKVKIEHQQEKKELLEQIHILKSFINDVSAIKDQKHVNKKNEKKRNDDESLYLQAQYENKKKKTTSDDWFIRVLQEQNALKNK